MSKKIQIIKLIEQDFDSPDCRVNNPRITARESIELADFIVALIAERDEPMGKLAQKQQLISEMDQLCLTVAEVNEIRAEAARAGFIAAINVVRLHPSRANHAVFVNQEAEKYAEKIRQGGDV